uniref:Uncharacterized protein n=1 Tax=Janibacter limosus TaxID=53458 RepID=A0AC61U7W9_9MICO|nr:hypothetical protein [Janibacter limosus]
MRTRPHDLKEMRTRPHDLKEMRTPCRISLRRCAPTAHDLKEMRTQGRAGEGGALASAVSAASGVVISIVSGSAGECRRRRGRAA